MGVRLLYFDAVHIAKIVGDDGVEWGRVEYGKANQIDLGGVQFVGIQLVEVQRGQVSILRKPDGVRKTDEDLGVVAGERRGTKKSVAKAEGFRLKNIKNLGGVGALGEVLNDVSLVGGDDHADLIGAGGDHTFDQVFSHGLGALYSIDGSGTDGQQFFGTAERLNALTCAGCGD